VFFQVAQTRWIVLSMEFPTVSVLTFGLFVPNVEEQCAPATRSALFATPYRLATPDTPDSLAPMSILLAFLALSVFGSLTVRPSYTS
jgi:hypothetical protein